ncbi:MAG TPA: hypothetical protein VFG52_11745 [Xanthomonadales bacterium]|nr:hypothetical protein [Xanthomonadales bacterium]
MAVVGCFFAAFGGAHAAQGNSLQEQIQAHALAGDLQPVSELLQNLDQAGLDEIDQIVLQQYRQRFTGDFKVDNPPGDSAVRNNELAGQVIRIYQHYWHVALTGALEPAAADQQLRHALTRVFPNPVPETGSADELFRQLEQAINATGLHASASFTPPWQDLYIWQAETTRIYQVELTDRREQVEVTFIEQPLLQGWQHYASLDRLATTGWASADGLFCLCWSYNLDSSAFLVSWLKHETRHSVDLREFPDMSEAQLEYRAKLTELAFSGPEVSSLLRQFAQTGSATGTSAHSLANYRVSHDIYREIFLQDLPAGTDPWQQLNPYQVAVAARTLLQKDTELLQRSSTVGAGLPATHVIGRG